MPSNVDYVSANKASRAASDWAAKKREKVERAAALRMERARAAQEAEARAAAGEDLTSDPSPVDQGPPAWWEDEGRAKGARERQAQHRPSSREARGGPYHFSDEPRDSGDRRQQQQRQRRQWNKAPDPQEWQPVADSNGAGQPGEVLWRRPQEEWQDHRAPKSQEPQFNLDFNAQESREEAQEREGAEDLDEATAAWLAMLRPDEPVAPPPPAPKPKAKKAARKPSGGARAKASQQQQQQQQEEEQDEAAKAWMGMLRADAAPKPRSGGRGAGRPYEGHQQASAGRYVADTYADDSDEEESCNYYAGRRGTEVPQASPPQRRRQPQQQQQPPQQQRQPLRRAGSWGAEDNSEDPPPAAAAAAGDGFHLPPVGGGRRHWGEQQARNSGGSSSSSAGVRARSPQEWGGGGAGGGGVPMERRQRRPSPGQMTQRADILILEPQGSEHQLERGGGGGGDGLPPRPKRHTSKGEEQLLEAAGIADSSEALSRRRRSSDHEDEVGAAAPLSSRRRSGTRSPSPSTPETLLLQQQQQQRRQRREEEAQDGASGRPRPLGERRRTSASPGPRTPSPQQQQQQQERSPVVSASGSRAPSPGAPRSAGRRAAPQSSPPRPEWVEDLSEPTREVVSQHDYDSRPIGKSRAAAPAAAKHSPAPAALEIPFGEAEDDPWHRGARVRKHKDSKANAAHGGRKPIRAPLNPEIAGKPESPKHGRKPMRDKLAPLRKAPGGGVHKVVGNKKDDDPVTRQMVDKRQSRKDNAPSFKAAIESYASGLTDVPARLGKGMAIKASQGLMPRNDGLGVPVYVRKRPLFAHEVKKNEYDVVAVDAEDMVVVHNCQMHADLKRMHIVHKAFPCAHAFDEHCTNEDVYGVAAAELVESAVFGGQGAIFMYGQTGSGKTHTMSSIESLGLHQIFADLRGQGGAAEVRIAIFEIAGNKCFDLLQGGHKQIVLKESEGGAVELMGAKEPSVRGPEDALDLVAEAKSRRSTASTAANATSSRSHCVTRVTVWNEAFGQGQLTLVDCAGSERNNDSMYHDAQARKESAEINASLYALRECIRLRRRQAEEAQLPNGGKHVHVPYRSSQLTRVLMECFTSSDAAVAVIATVSPSSTDTEHTMSTLQTVLMMSGASKDAFAEVKQDVQLAGIQKPPDVRLVKPINWTAEDVRDWLKGLKRGAFREYAYGLPGDINGRALVRMNKAAIAQICAGGKSDAGLAIFNALRNEIDRVDTELRRQRKGVVEMNARLRGGW